MHDSSLFYRIDKHAQAIGYTGNFLLFLAACFEIKQHSDVVKLAAYKALALQNQQADSDTVNDDIAKLTEIYNLLDDYYENDADISRFDNVSCCEQFFDKLHASEKSSRAQIGERLPDNWLGVMGAIPTRQPALHSGIYYQNNQVKQAHAHILPVCEGITFYSFSSVADLLFHLPQMDKDLVIRMYKVLLFHDCTLPVIVGVLSSTWKTDICKLSLAEETVAISLSACNQSLPRYRRASKEEREKANRMLKLVNTTIPLTGAKTVRDPFTKLPVLIALV